MSLYLGDFAEDATVDFKWSTFDTDGASITRGTNGTVSVYIGNGTTQTTTGVTDTEDFDSLTGIHHCRIDLSADAAYVTGSECQVVLSAASIDSVTVNAVIAHFSIERAGGALALLKGANGLAAIKGDTADIETDTQDIQSRLPAALVGGRIDANVGAISGDATAADTLESYTDGTTPMPVNVTHFGGTGGTFASGRPEVKTDSLGNTAKSDVNAEVLDVLNVDTFAEPGQENPPATTTLVKKIGYAYKLARNKSDQTDSLFQLYADDGSTVDQKAAISDDGTTLERGELETGP